MTIGKETRYLGGLIRGEWDDLPSGTQLSIRDKGIVGEVKVVDPNTLAFRTQVGGKDLEQTLVGEEINASGFRIGPSNLAEMIVGKATYLYWDPDKPGGEDMEMVRQGVWRLQPTGI